MHRYGYFRLCIVFVVCLDCMAADMIICTDYYVFKACLHKMSKSCARCVLSDNRIKHSLDFNSDIRNEVVVDHALILNNIKPPAVTRTCMIRISAGDSLNGYQMICLISTMLLPCSEILMTIATTCPAASSTADRGQTVSLPPGINPRNRQFVLSHSCAAV